ncbi:hypothetical protein BJV78DRAFT_1255906 [Lactifluus subvellereus]|nr:hypothetical protein BJV78DRAFT_1255906 [Lactifluus subvellereus]
MVEMFGRSTAVSLRGAELCPKYYGPSLPAVPGMNSRPRPRPNVVKLSRGAHQYTPITCWSSMFIHIVISGCPSGGVTVDAESELIGLSTGQAIGLSPVQAPNSTSRRKYRARPRPSYGRRARTSRWTICRYLPQHCEIDPACHLERQYWRIGVGDILRGGIVIIGADVPSTSSKAVGCQFCNLQNTRATPLGTSKTGRFSCLGFYLQPPTLTYVLRSFSQGWKRTRSFRPPSFLSVLYNDRN